MRTHTHKYTESPILLGISQQKLNSWEEKLRVKALYRRALALEALQRLEEAEVDINLALKACRMEKSWRKMGETIYFYMGKSSIHGGW